MIKCNVNEIITIINNVIKLNYLNIMNSNLETKLYFMLKFLIKIKILYLKLKFKALFCHIKIKIK